MAHFCATFAVKLPSIAGLPLRCRRIDSLLDSGRFRNGQYGRTKVRGWREGPSTRSARSGRPSWSDGRFEVGSRMGTPPPTFFCKCVKRKGFKSFVLKVCDSKGFADAFLVKCVKLKSLGGILASFEVSPSIFGPKPVFLPRALGEFLPRNQRQQPSGRPSRKTLRVNLAITTEARIPQMTGDCQGLIYTA